MKSVNLAALSALLAAVGCSAAGQSDSGSSPPSAAPDLDLHSAATVASVSTTPTGTGAVSGGAVTAGGNTGTTSDVASLTPEALGTSVGISTNITSTAAVSVTGANGQACKVPGIDARRSLEVTDVPVLSAVDANGNPRFDLQRVLAQLLATGGAPSSETPLELYERIFDTNNSAAGGVFSDGQHCDDQTDSSGRPAVSGSAITCPRQEGGLAGPHHVPFCGSNPADCDPYSPIAIINRFDLAPPSGANCGQYRIIFAKGTDGVPPVTRNSDGSFTFHAPPTLDRNLVIFEAVLPNPNPSCGIRACGPVQQFWANLSTITDPQQRAAQLDTFYFTGLPGFAPVISAANFTAATGQIRANQFMNTAPNTPVTGNGWELREYKLDFNPSCGTAGGCPVHVDLVTDKSNPFAALFAPGGSFDPRTGAFQDPNDQSSFINMIPNLAITGQTAIDTLNEFFVPAASPYNGGQSTEQPSNLFPGATTTDVETFVENGDDTEYTKAFALGGSSNAFLSNVNGELTKIGSRLTATQVVNRALTQACAGCHELSSNAPTQNNSDVGASLPWPQSLGFVQISEQNVETCENEFCWEISPALKNVFLPFRRTNMMDFLKGLSCTPATCGAPPPAGSPATAATPAEVLTDSIGARSE